MPIVAELWRMYEMRYIVQDGMSESLYTFSATFANLKNLLDNCGKYRKFRREQAWLSGSLFAAIIITASTPLLKIALFGVQDSDKCDSHSKPEMYCMLLATISIGVSSIMRTAHVSAYRHSYGIGGVSKEDLECAAAAATTETGKTTDECYSLENMNDQDKT